MRVRDDERRDADDDRRARRVCVLRGVRALGWGHDGEREARSEGESVGWRRRRISRRRRVLAIQS